MFTSTLTDTLTDPLADIAPTEPVTAENNHTDIADASSDSKPAVDIAADTATDTAADADVTDTTEAPTITAEQYAAWKAAVLRAEADIATIRNHLGEAVTVEAATELYKLANGDPVEAIAMHLDPKYAEKARAAIEARHARDAEDIHDLQTHNTEVDPQTAIRRLRAVANSKDYIMQQIIDAQKRQKREGQANAEVNAEADAEPDANLEADDGETVASA